jgi:hypothetical protein
MPGEVDLTEYERLMERAAACQAELETIEREFAVLVARWNAGTPDEHAMSKRVLAAWLEADKETLPVAQQRQAGIRRRANS